MLLFFSVHTSKCDSCKYNYRFSFFEQLQMIIVLVQVVLLEMYVRYAKIHCMLSLKLSSVCGAKRLVNMRQVEELALNSMIRHKTAPNTQPPANRKRRAEPNIRHKQAKVLYFSMSPVCSIHQLTNELLRCFDIVSCSVIRTSAIFVFYLLCLSIFLNYAH